MTGNPGTAYYLTFNGATATLDSGMTQAQIQTALEALRESYPDLEADESVESVAGQPALGHNIRFFSFDLTNTCWIRSFYTSAGTVLVMWQCTDLELERHEPVLRAICSSLKVEED